jgi:predicted ester cyclase
MSTRMQTVAAFLDACETGQGWDACRVHCHDDAPFSAQADTLADVTTVEGYTAWMQGILQLLPDGEYELTALAEDASRDQVVATAVFRGTHTGEGGPVAPTGRSTATEYAYVLRFDGDRIDHLTKVWNDVHVMRELGWA